MQCHLCRGSKYETIIVSKKKYSIHEAHTNGCNLEFSGVDYEAVSEKRHTEIGYPHNS